MPGSVQSIERAAAVLRLLSGGAGRLGCVEVANSLGLAKGTAHGILRTLQEVGFVEQDRPSGKYLLGAGLLELTAWHLDPNELRSLALNWTDTLAARSGEAVRLGVLDGPAVLVVHHGFRPDDTEQSLDVGSHRPAHACALGKVLLAYDAGAAALALRGVLPAYTPLTCATPHRLSAALAKVRAQGWAFEAQEREMGEAGIAAPVRDRGGLTVAAVGITGAVDDLCDSDGAPRPALLALVQSAARAISRELAPGS
ncbi:MAG TPA: IclR family transcriptional regulator [Mycobacteriales bacterium]|jgi:DNA-binding IclR family transcriptional regulator|nr:IclR family transcriptional regulator [Mycobacteriales bacterium]